jgi:hypothetical protein
MIPALLTAEPLATSTRHVVELRDVVMRFGIETLQQSRRSLFEQELAN